MNPFLRVASSELLFCLYNRSKKGFVSFMRQDQTMGSKHFMTINIKANGWESCSKKDSAFVGTGQNLDLFPNNFMRHCNNLSHRPRPLECTVYFEDWFFGKFLQDPPLPPGVQGEEGEMGGGGGGQSRLPRPARPVVGRFAHSSHNSSFLALYRENSYELTALYCITIQAIELERKNHKHQCSEQVLCMHTKEHCNI